ncbi:hypothetical protein PROFUN_04290 [Planoprotostelium fungivorum]|uniref:t-SNARE coiled-coil homology domain-containing protein n=1 Tax=Planoprotostelium fungivorum TaxID=1890364 RepID=A0A2P6NV67_9EUKA|nr:hypothetical protein PROFUN_04290 [Planoprotostelium fungivorum]
MSRGGDRDTLFSFSGNSGAPRGSNSPEPAGGRRWGTVSESEQQKGQSNQQIYASNQSKLEDQDRALDAISDSLGRTKQIAIEIGKEADEHTQLIDEIDGHVNRVNPMIRNTTKRIDRVATKSSTKGLWLCICLLFIILLVVIGLAFGLP